MDKVFINNLEVEAIIGIFDWEREVRQIISINLEMEFDNKIAAKSDDINDALDYKKVGKRVTAYVERSKYKLVESLAEQIAKLVLREFPVSSLTVSVTKPGAMRGSESVGIRITRP
ncbi:MAG: dihydroneopterin aldolase [Gammaproteobacteria bacterium]|nr:dihydroneopterin aldolase [Gammaproteobacteria bacterium]HJL95578.1 dihydroneopterin aldolase [SAR86 cluster bacterium]HJM59319.1 dihydroneopterin aldolase [SAR86 cluster bacterium]|tara:strand:- start:17570 stop:17917 length:348 start_codon:yes stop_codon:yes gene_type:complete